MDSQGGSPSGHCVGDPGISGRRSLVLRRSRPYVFWVCTPDALTSLRQYNTLPDSFVGGEGLGHQPLPASSLPPWSTPPYAIYLGGWFLWAQLRQLV